MGDRSSAGAAISGHGGATADYHWTYNTFRDFKDGRHMTTTSSSMNTASASQSQGNTVIYTLANGLTGTLTGYL